ncbi:MAG: glycosyltransferase family A protein [Thermoplasmatales archaeon]|nr:glycosyltransferase family 2 protein [Candidatus Thermoplasmatota archaeon]MDA8055416.1 glycosyltransferase family A protein [Thermoplasmatales archaeon]
MSSGVDVIVRTYNSESTLRNCLKSVTELLPANRILVIDHHSKDDTLSIANEYKCEIYSEDEGLGRATSLGIERSTTDMILFVDSDITVKRSDFFDIALEYMKDQNVGAVVGMSLGHKFSYGLPLGMTMFRRLIVQKVNIPGYVMSRETYFIQRFFRKNGLRVKYIPDSNVHTPESRKFSNWPEWQGSWVRLTSGLNPREVVYSLLVVFLLLSNSRNVKNFFYFPIFQAKLLRGFIEPEKWSRSFRPETARVSKNKGDKL